MTKKREVEIFLRDEGKVRALKITRQDVLDAMNVFEPEKLGVANLHTMVSTFFIQIRTNATVSRKSL
jgi:hypothetical protein